MKTPKWLVSIIFVFCCVGIASLAWPVDYLKVDGVDKGKVVQGVITKIEGNKVTLKDTSGKLHTIGVKGLDDIKGKSQDDKHSGDKDERYRLRGFRVGDTVKIQGGNLTKIAGPVKSDSMKIFPKVEHK